MKYSQRFEPIQPYVQPETLGSQPYEPSPQERQLKAQTSATSAQAKLAEQINKRNSGWARTILAMIVGVLALVCTCYYLFGETAALVVLGFVLIASYDTLKSAQSSAVFTRILDTVATFQARDAATDKARYGAFRAEATHQSAQLRAQLQANRQAALPAQTDEETEDGEWGIIQGEDE